MDLFGNSEPTLPFEMPSGNDYSAQWCDELRGYQVIVPHGELFYAERFFDKETCDKTVAFFQENDTFDWKHRRWRDLSPGEFEQVHFANIRWKQDTIKLYGKSIPLPRLTAWYGDSGKSYTYSGIMSTPNEWNEGLLDVKRKVEQLAGVEFNSVLLNWYRDGEDSLNWHADDEKELGRNPIIASANFGEIRDFVIRKNDDNGKKIVLPLKHGTLLLMRGELQHYWRHSVPKRRNVSSSRFNLTFRRIGITSQETRSR